MLSTAQNGTASVPGLKGVLERLVERLPADDPDRSVDDGALSRIVCARPPHQDVTEAQLALKALNRQLKYAAADTRPRIEDFIVELERDFMLLVPLEYWPGQRHVCKLSYDAAIRPQQASRGARFYTSTNRVLSSIGWLDASSSSTTWR